MRLLLADTLIGWGFRRQNKIKTQFLNKQFSFNATEEEQALFDEIVVHAGVLCLHI